MTLPSSIKIGGVPYSLTVVDRDLDVCHSGSGQKLWGEISYSKHSIRVARSFPEQEFRTILHEVLHGIIEAYGVRELKDEKGDHMEIPVNQLATGLAEALESMGIRSFGGAP